MGRFCLTAQAIVLLGKVLQNVNDKPCPQNFRDDEAKLLDNTIAALTNVAYEEGRSRGVGVCSPITLLFR
jgi:hypothetical protein